MSETIPARGAAARADRIPNAERREQLLDAASLVFGERGYVGATTDQVARAAGISQAYVVRLFGGKEALFLGVLGRALDRLTAAFRGAVAESEAAGDDVGQRITRLGGAYADLIGDRGILLCLMQAFTMGSDPVIGSAARSGFLDIYRLLRDEAGFDAETTTRFLAEGMLFNTLVALRLPEVPESAGVDGLDDLLRCAFRAKLPLVRATMARSAG